MIKFKHIIITRFNLPNRWTADKQGNTVLDSHWLVERFDLFENFCLPSVEGQTTKNFEWWVYFDINTNRKFKDRINNIEKISKIFKSRFVKSYEEFENNLPLDIYNDVKNNNIEWLITTRLDNDDMLAKNTVEILQKNANFKNNCLLEIPSGYTLEIGEKSKLRKLRTQLNPFISYVEKVEIKKVIKSVYYYQHTEWKEVDSVIVTNRPQWVQIIHNKNVLNRFNGELVSPLNFHFRFNFNREALNLNVSYKLLLQRILRRYNFKNLTRLLIKLKILLQ